MNNYKDLIINQEKSSNIYFTIKLDDLSDIFSHTLINQLKSHLKQERTTASNLFSNVIHFGTLEQIKLFFKKFDNLKHQVFYFQELVHREINEETIELFYFLLKYFEDSKQNFHFNRNKVLSELFLLSCEENSKLKNEIIKNNFIYEHPWNQDFDPLYYSIQDEDYDLSKKIIKQKAYGVNTLLTFRLSVIHNPELFDYYFSFFKKDLKTKFEFVDVYEIFNLNKYEAIPLIKRFSEQDQRMLYKHFQDTNKADDFIDAITKMTNIKKELNFEKMTVYMQQKLLPILL